MKKHGKKYKAALELVDKKKVYSIEEGIELVKKTSITKFDSSVGISFHLNIDTRKADQLVRGTVVLPNGNGKTIRVLALTSNKADDAKKAGADFAGGKELLDKIINEKWFDFDVICATPDMMGEIGKAGKVLGPKGLMPNPKTGTVGPDIAKMVSELKAGKIEYRADKAGNINVSVGKVSFDSKKLEENIRTIISTIIKVRPQTVKGQYILSCGLSSTMGPGVKIDYLG